MISMKLRKKEVKERIEKRKQKRRRIAGKKTVQKKKKTRGF